ncbi:hypothetical protein M885DRAFT_615370 [Pelagophyceae sp. CCMP2097]|nr:hypothetical protein M885DRAFT_615370 [Pelagophyceae sp. CCMP2097]
MGIMGKLGFVDILHRGTVMGLFGCTLFLTWTCIDGVVHIYNFRSEEKRQIVAAAAAAPAKTD